MAAAVFQQERLEGDLRSAHARLRAAASSAALSNGSGDEHAALQVHVSCVPIAEAGSLLEAVIL